MNTNTKMSCIEISENQPTICIGMIGAVNNGKSSITKLLTGIKTQRFGSEKKNNKTIKLGYANTKIYKCLDCKDIRAYQSYIDECVPMCEYNEKHRLELKRHISFVDTPGHNDLMITMINGTSVMDYVIVVESANNNFQDQTKEHISICREMNIQPIALCFNKIDLVDKKTSYIRINEMEKYFIDNNFESFMKIPIIPISANIGYNKHYLCKSICEFTEEKEFDDKNDVCNMNIIRSFNINKQNVSMSELKGGVIGGTIINGNIKIDDNITIYPGIIKYDTGNEIWGYYPIKSKVLSINSQKKSLEFAVSGGLLGIQLDIDPALTAKDRLSGNIVCKNNESKVKIYDIIKLKFHSMKEYNFNENNNDDIILNSNSSNIISRIIDFNDNIISFKCIDKPICIFDNNIITISVKNNDSITIIGTGTLIDGTLAKINDIDSLNV